MLSATSLLLWNQTALKAQPNYPPPTGVYCSCPPSTGNGYGSVLPQVASKSYVAGILVRTVWQDMEPTDNTYNWSLIDDQIEAAESYGKKISLAVGGGPNSPDWLYELGVDSLSYSFPFAGTIPIPWDALYLEKWVEFVAELGDRYQDEETIELVYITTSSGNGFEMQLPFSPTPSYESIGYTDALMIDGWQQAIDAFGAAFPNHYLTNDFHPVNGSNIVADSVYAYALQALGDRYGASAWWWTQNNTTVYPEQYTILQNSAETQPFAGVQFAASGIDNPDTFGEGGMPVALELAISNQVCYWEIWNSDIVDGSFDELLSGAECTTLDEADVQARSDFNIFPNPSSDYLRFENPHGFTQYQIVNILGQALALGTLNHSANRISISDLPNGNYILKLSNGTSQSWNGHFVKE